MGAIASQITSLTIVYSIIYSDAYQRKHHSSASLAFVRGIHRGLVSSLHKWPVTRKMFLFDDIMYQLYPFGCRGGFPCFPFNNFVPHCGSRTQFKSTLWAYNPNLIKMHDVQTPKLIVHSSHYFAHDITGLVVNCGISNTMVLEIP